MAQTYKMMLGTSGKQWEQLTVKDDGTMTMTFHGTDREICHEVTENADGWLCYPGGMFPGLESGRWQLIALRGQAPCNPPSATHTGDSPREPRPRRQRKPRKPRVALDGRTAENTSDISPQPSSINHQPSATMKAIGMVAAATVALFVIYETGLLIPLGLIGLASGGILK